MSEKHATPKKKRKRNLSMGSTLGTTASVLEGVQGAGCGDPQPSPAVPCVSPWGMRCARRRVLTPAEHPVLVSYLMYSVPFYAILEVNVFIQDEDRGLEMLRTLLKVT